MNTVAWIISALCGGALIGIAASLLLLLEGRVFGISGIVGNALIPKKGDIAWRCAVVLGLVSAGFATELYDPTRFLFESNASPFLYICAGLLVGFGTQLANGCTSGHGVCGMSRFSKRSIVATMIFIASAVLTVAIRRLLGDLS